MKAIIVGKSGGTLYTRQYIKQRWDLNGWAPSATSGEQGETEGLIRHLAEVFDGKVIHFGQLRGELPGNVLHVAPHIDGMNDYSTQASQEENWRIDVMNILQALGGAEPVAFMQVAGYSPTMSWIGNPRAVQLQAAAIRYQAPQLNIIEQFRLPRVVINNDPRTYPKDQEMSLGWKHITPVALLDQTWGEKSQVVGGVKYTRKSCYAACESWAYHLRNEQNTHENFCVAVAHAHIGDGCKQKGRARAWDTILRVTPEDFRCHGNGWEHYVNYNPLMFPGSIKPNEVMELLATTTCCPAVAVAPQFYTGKVYVCEAQGCIPLLYTGNEYTWDPKFKMIPEDHPTRVSDDQSLSGAAWYAREYYAEYRELWRDLCKPDWTILHDLLDDLMSGRGVDSKVYGGYLR